MPRPALDARSWRLLAAGTSLVLFAGWLAWYSATPPDLATNDTVVNANGVVGTPLYVGMFATTKDFDRTIRISGVKVHTTSSAELEVTPLLCRRGTVGVTTDPDQFCSGLVDPEGERLTSGDSIVVMVEASQPTLAVIDQIEIAYREDIRWDTQPAGTFQAIVSMAGRGTD